MVGCQSLFVDDGSNIKTLRHFDIIQVLNHSYGLSDSQSLGCQASKDVGLCITRKGNESLGVLNAFLLKQAKVTPVTMDNHRVDIVQLLIQLFAARLVSLDDFQVHIVGSCLRYAYRCLAASHNDDILYIGIVLLAGNLADIRNVFTGGHKIGDVVDAQLIVATGY